MRVLSKSKLLAFRQCPKRLWLETYRRDLSTHAIGASAGFTAGRSVGEVARSLFDPDRSGVLVDVGVLGVGGAVTRTGELLQARNAIFEAAFVGGTASAFADVLLPVETAGSTNYKSRPRCTASRMNSSRCLLGKRIFPPERISVSTIQVLVEFTADRVGFGRDREE
jgi:hypothetical protein